MRVGLITDYARFSMLTGPVMMTRFFREHLELRGHSVQLIGPEDPEALPGELPENTVLCRALTFPHYKGFYVPIPIQPELFTRPYDLDIIFGQANSLFLHYGVWLRQFRGIPLLATNTIHLPSYTNHILSDRIMDTDWLRGPLDWRMSVVERDFAENIYNNTDGVVVLSRFMVPYWRDRGVTAPIHVIPRPVRPEIFSRPAQRDPFPGHFAPGGRVLSVCRQSREKSVDRLIRIFAAFVEPVVPGASLTLVGDGPEQPKLEALASRLGVAHRVNFAGMVPQAQLPDFYQNADVFAYTSLSETFGCVVSEALWSHLPAVALDDRMGVAHQVLDMQNGRLIPTRGFVDPDADLAFGRSLTMFLNNPALRLQMGETAGRLARAELSPERIMTLTLEAFEAAIAHRRRTLPNPASVVGPTAQALVTWRNVHAWMYQNASFWMMGKFFRKPPKRIPDVLAQAVKIPTISRSVGGRETSSVPAATGPRAISLVG
jgi:glycosyltransferase involved in cell wall biosynthesis